MPAIVCHLPSTNSIANIRPAYVTDTETRPSNALRMRYNSKESAKYNAKPVIKKNYCLCIFFSSGYFR